MQKLLTACTIISCLALPSMSTNYYVSSSGDDTNNDGKSEAKPWKTISKANGISLVAGDKVLFKKGDSFRGRLNLSNKSGTSSSPIYMGAYGSGERPQILGSRDMSTASDWVNMGGNIWEYKHAFSGDVGSLIFGNNSDFGFKKVSNGDVNKQGYFILTNSKIRLYSTQNPVSAYQHIEGAEFGHMVSISGSKYVTIDGLHIKYGGTHGIQGSGPSNLIIRNCEFSYLGGCIMNLSSGYNRFGNAIEFWNSAQDCLIEKNIIRDIYDTGVTNQGNGSGGVFRNLTFRNNLIWNCGLSSFESWHHGGGSTIDNIIFYHNTCAYVEGGWGGRDRTYSGSFKAHLAFLSFYGSTFQNLIIKNNIFHHVKKGRYVFGNDPFPFDKVQFDNNLISMNPEADQIFLTGSGSNWKSITDKAQYIREMEPNSKFADPQFVGTYDFRLKSSSPAINAGANLGVNEDINGATRPTGGKYDIGCYEYGAPVSSAPRFVPIAVQHQVNPSLNIGLSNINHAASCINTGSAVYDIRGVRISGVGSQTKALRLPAGAYIISQQVASASPHGSGHHIR